MKGTSMIQIHVISPQGNLKVKDETKTVARNEVESGFMKGTSMIQIHVISPQGNLKVKDETKTVAHNEVESGFMEGTSMTKSTSFLRKGI